MSNLVIDFDGMIDCAVEAGQESAIRAFEESFGNTKYLSQDAAEEDFASFFSSYVKENDLSHIKRPKLLIRRGIA